MALTFGIVLSGCGVFDGSEIHEAVFTLLAADRAGASIIYIAPDMEQAGVVNHATGKPDISRRNVLQEAARIARGNIRSASEIQAAELDALLFPGGYGAAKNLCDFAMRGPRCDVQLDIARLVREMHALRRPMGFMCIAPVIAARVLGEFGISVTIGNDAETASAIEACGARHVERAVQEICWDEEHGIVSAPAYMYGSARPSEVAAGIDKAVSKVAELCAQRAPSRS